ncbi:tetraspanin-9-like isoform X1 [Anneissia japonica]|uniref:tetraspanin-9-like isoform X1 n=1 Tax=Anneissia japonica TaxID=1529436 RepID=UPI0014258C6D|nr:tetraspanin-9-like isoform X1 [Anneissia japonica]XP_033096160.1 tetraspanin-9-like isoform X2 [Anneissia japonica]XP_033096161.1 tetraspanin-9-like isoform X1 [Anneissia japonica]
MAKCLESLCMNICISFFSVTMLLVGVAAAVFAIVILATDINPDYRDITVNPTFTQITYGLFFIWLVFSLVTIVGCFTHIKKNRPCMYIFFIMLLTTCSIILISSIMLITVGKKGMKQSYEQEVKNSMNNFGLKGFEKLTNTWNAVQSQQQCCGYSSSIDWNGVTINGRKSVFPDSCCIERFEFCGQSAKTSQVFPRGCEEIITQTINSVISNLFIISLGFGLGMIILMVFTLCVLCRSDAQQPGRDIEVMAMKVDKEKQKPPKPKSDEDENKMSVKEKLKGIFRKKENKS